MKVLRRWHISSASCLPTIQPLDDVPRLLQHARLLKVGIAHRHIDIRVAKGLPDLLNVERVTSSGSQGNV